MQALLQKYNLLSSSLQEYGRNATDEELSKAIQDLQFMVNLPETGEMDNATWQRLTDSRCGRPDYVSDLRKGSNRNIKVIAKQHITWG